MVTAKNTQLRGGKLSSRVIRVDEIFSQKESLTTRARRMHELCEYYGLEPEKRGVHIWGDAANPQDIREINLAFRNGLPEADEQGHETGRRIISRLRVVAVARENKARETAVTKINDRLDENILLFRRSIGADHEWMLGANAGNEGIPMNRSRLMWEIDNWAVPVPIEGKAQKQNPDDDTADGADAMASIRYAP